MDAGRFGRRPNRSTMTSTAACRQLPLSWRTAVTVVLVASVSGRPLVIVALRHRASMCSPREGVLASGCSVGPRRSACWSGSPGG